MNFGLYASIGFIVLILVTFFETDNDHTEDMTAGAWIVLFASIIFFWPIVVLMELFAPNSGLNNKINK